MQDIAIRTAVFIQNVVHRMREERGQTAVEYAGILLMVAVIFGVIFAADIDGKIREQLGPRITDLLKGGKD